MHDLLFLVATGWTNARGGASEPAANRPVPCRPQTGSECDNSMIATAARLSELKVEDEPARPRKLMPLPNSKLRLFTPIASLVQGRPECFR
jgi:hypothetical protein